MFCTFNTFWFGERETWKVTSTEALHKLCEGVKSFTCMFRHSATEVKGAVTENSTGLWGTTQKYLVPTGKKAPHPSLLHIITFTFPAYTIYQSMLFSVPFHVLSWERNWGSKPCSSHGESTGGALRTPSITHFHIVHPLWQAPLRGIGGGGFGSHLYCWIASSEVAQQTSMLPAIVHRHQMDLSIFLKETGGKYTFLNSRKSLQLFAMFRESSVQSPPGKDSWFPADM